MLAQMFPRIWFMINYKFGPQKLPEDGLCQASNVLLGRRHTFLKNVWLDQPGEDFEKQHLVSLSSGAGTTHGTHTGRGETCPGLSTDMFPQGKTSREIPWKCITLGRSCQLRACMSTWDRAFRSQHLLPPTGFLLVWLPSSLGKKTHLKHSLKSSKNQVRQSSKELPVTYN